jgi:hypothetical protein
MSSPCVEVRRAAKRQQSKAESDTFFTTDNRCPSHVHITPVDNFDNQRPDRGFSTFTRFRNSRPQPLTNSFQPDEGHGGTAENLTAGSDNL